jgi:hypothetical protein
MTEPTPKFVLDYIEFLKKFYKTYPAETAARFNVPAGTLQVRFEPYFQSDRGWAVLHLDVSSGRSLLTEFVDPPIAQDSAMPPLEFDPGIPLVIPRYAPPEGYFVLIVENVGLPAGYAASTTVQIRTLGNSLAVTGGGAGFSVPFRGQYELPVLGTSPLTNNLPEQLRYDLSFAGKVKTLVGDYEAEQPFYAIYPKSGELHRRTVKWFKSDPFLPPAPPATPPHPPVVLPKPPVITPTQPIPTAPPRVGITSVQTQPIFYPSTTPRRATPLPPAPSSIRLSTPFKDPDNSYRATSVQQMFSFTPDPSSRSIIYSIGVRPDAIRPTTYRIRNNTTNAQLQFTFKVPEFLFLSVPHTLLINPQDEILVTVSFNESYARDKSLTRVRMYTDVFEWDVIPINVRGPVYVMRNLPPVIYSQPGESIPTQAIRNQAALPATGQIGNSTGFDVDFYKALYIAFDTPNLTMIRGERRGIKLDAWIGDSSVSPSSPRAIALQFEPNSIIWEVSNPSLMSVEAINGSNNATLVAIAPGTSEFKAKIVKPPVNVLKSKWDLLYNANTEIRGGGRRVLLPNAVSGIEIVGTNNIYTSTSQITGR